MRRQFSLVLVALVLAVLAPAHFFAQTAREFHTGWHRGSEVTYQVVDGLAILEGDIILGSAKDLESKLRPDSTYTALTSRYWPNATVPYAVDPALPNPQRVTDAVAYYGQNTAVRFVPRTTEANYVTFVRTTRGDGVCYSSIGMVGGQQFIMTEDSCNASGLVHEMGHTIGLFHEQQRKDRNNFITVLYENVDKTQFGEYPIGGTSEQDAGFYDYASHMHYAATSFSLNGKNTIQTAPPGIPLAEPTYFSAGDIDAVQRLYGAPPTATTVTSNPTGLGVVVDGVTVITPQTFAWTPGSTHTIAANTQGTGVRYQFGVWSDGGAQSHTITSSADVTVYSVSFVRQLLVSTPVSPAGSGMIVVDPPSPDGYYAAYDDFQVRAVPAPGYAFQRWTNCPTTSISANPSLARARTAPVICAATFTQSPVTAILTDPPGRPITVDGSTYATPANFVWTPGSTHTLAVFNVTFATTAPVRYAFQSWDDGGAASHTVTANPNSTTITARFTTQYEFAVTQPPATLGSITLNPPTPDGYYDSGTQVQVTAVPASGLQLFAWSGDLAGTANPQTVTMTEQRTAAASFTRTPPALVAVHGATFLSGAVAPGEIVTIFGSGLGPPALTGLQLDSSGKVAKTLAGTQVMFDGVAAPIVYASANQTAAIVPYAVAGKTSTVLQIVYNGVRTPAVGLSVAAVQPGFFTANSSGKGLAAIINQDGSYNSIANPAPRGSVVSFYVSGEGQTVPAGVDGLLAADPLSKPVLPVAVRIGGSPAVVEYAGGAPGLVAGVMQVNARIPSDLLPGSQSLYLVVGTTISPVGVTIAIK